MNRCVTLGCPIMQLLSILHVLTLTHSIIISHFLSLCEASRWLALKSGFCYYELGNFEKSLTIFKQIITDYPNSSVSRLAREKINTIR